ncbi:hypothetical protein BH09ACT8_BH09ACT8_18700 [soil metagenome]
MSSWSRVISFDELAQRDIMYFLPPGGLDNGVFASNWVQLADLDADDVAPVLERLAGADVGGHVASPGGGRRDPRRVVIHRLYVDAMQYGSAESVLLDYLRDKRRQSTNRSRYGRNSSASSVTSSPRSSG